MVMFVICAGSTDEAQAWARVHGVPQRQCLYASSTRKIDGLRDFAVVRLRGFFGRRDCEEIEASIRRSELKMTSPLAGSRDLAGG